MFFIVTTDFVGLPIFSLQNPSFCTFKKTITAEIGLQCHITKDLWSRPQDDIKKQNDTILLKTSNQDTWIMLDLHIKKKN